MIKKDRIICVMCEKPRATIKDRDFSGSIVLNHYYNQIRGKICKTCLKKLRRNNKKFLNKYKRIKLEWYKLRIKQMKRKHLNTTTTNK
jgi:hypothetical protein